MKHFYWFWATLLLGNLVPLGAQTQKTLNDFYQHRYYTLRANEVRDVPAVRPLKRHDYVEDRAAQPQSALYIATTAAGLRMTDLRIKPATRFTISLWAYASKRQNVLNFFGQTSALADTTGYSTGKAVKTLFPAFDFGSAQLPARQWLHLVITYQDGLTLVYVNGQEQPAIEWEYDNFDQLNILYNLGFGYMDDNFLQPHSQWKDAPKTCFIGSISDLYVHNAVASAAERKALYMGTHEAYKGQCLPPSTTSTATHPTNNDQLTGRGGDRKNTPNTTTTTTSSSTTKTERDLTIEPKKPRYDQKTESALQSTKYHALIIYVSEYEEDAIPDLPGTENDAQQMADVLQKH